MCSAPANIYKSLKNVFFLSVTLIKTKDSRTLKPFPCALKYDEAKDNNLNCSRTKLCNCSLVLML